MNKPMEFKNGAIVGCAASLLSALLIFAGPAQADPGIQTNTLPNQATTNATNPYTVLNKSPAFVNSGINSLQNMYNPQLRFGAGGRIAIPGNGAGNANPNSAVSPYGVGGSGGIVAPPPKY